MPTSASVGGSLTLGARASTRPSGSALVLRVVAMVLVGLRLGRVCANDEQDLSAPENLVSGRCLGLHGRLDFGRDYHIFHLEMEPGGDEPAGSGAESGAQGLSDAAAGVAVDLLDERGRAGRRCQYLRTDGRRALYACNGAAQGIAVHGERAARFAPCAVSVWGEPVAKRSRMLALARDLYSSANLKGDGCTECKEPLDMLQTCTRISLVRSTGGDEEFSRWLAACTNDAGTIWLRKGKHARALQMFRRALPLIMGGSHPIIILNIVQVARKLCAWSDWHNETQLVQQTVEVHNRKGIALMNPYMVETYGLSPATILDMVSIISLQTFEALHDPSAAPSLSSLLPTLTPLRAFGWGGGREGKASASAFRVRVGYYSMTGLNGGRLSIGRFLQSVIGLHGVQGGAPALEAFCYGEQENDDGTDIYQTLARGCAGRRVLDTAALSFEAKARAVRADGLDVFVDLSGYTHAPSFSPSSGDGVRFKSSLHRLMALGMAPVQISWWGYTGTLGAEFVHFVATDVLASPPEMRGYYSEKMLYLPGTTYLVSDHSISRQEVILQHPDAVVEQQTPLQRGAALVSSPSVQRPALPGSLVGRMAADPAAGVPSRGEVLGTKEQQVSVVFCSFNQFYKLSPDIWRVWMEILQRTGSDSVLWMLEFDGDAVNNLVEEAVMHGVHSSRIIVTSLLPLHQEFLSKGTCDLYLDTPDFNAHTTAKDALWSGVPVLTLAGEGMASRIAASLTLLLDPAGVTVARNIEDYVKLAVRLGKSPRTLARLKRSVQERRWTSPLFDTLGWMGLWQRQLQNIADLVAAGYFPPAHLHLVGGSTRDAS